LPFRSKPTRTAKGRKKLKQEQAAQLAESGAASAPLSSALLPQTPKKQNPPGPVHKSSWKKRASRSDFILFRFPPEIKQEVLSYLSLQRVSSYRRVCQEFYDIVAECEKALAGPQIEEHLYRLQRGIRATSSCGMPTDARSFLRCLKVWTLFRGSFLDTECSQNSLCSNGSVTWLESIPISRPSARNGMSWRSGHCSPCRQLDSKSRSTAAETARTAT
jgi:hypothetical protein